MIYNGKKIEFPAIMRLSFFKLVEHWEKIAKEEGNLQAGYARELLREVEKYPELREGISDVTKLNDYQESFEKLCQPIFPSVLASNEIKILTPPFYFKPIYTSERFKKIIAASGEPFEFTMKDVSEDLFYMYCCFFILESYYGYKVTGTTPQIYEIENKALGFKRVYKLLINADLSEFIPTERAVEITRADYEHLMENFGNISLWKEKFPPYSWIIRGVNLVSLVDITSDQSITSITSSLLIKPMDSFEDIRHSIRRMFNDIDLSIGMMSYENDSFNRMPHDEIESLLLFDADKLDCRTDLCGHAAETFFIKKEPLVISDTESYHNQSGSGLSKKLLESGYKSYIIAPLVHEDELLGFMEIGSKNKYGLHRGSIEILNQILPILSMAKKRFQTEAQNRIEAVIQQECTSIHSSVKWRFEEEARKFIKRSESSQTAHFNNLVFDHLYPLYGQLDIKGSSEKRNKAVSKDLVKQLDAVSKVIEVANAENPMPIYEGLLYHLDSCISELKKNLAAGSEHRILSFLTNDIYPVFQHLRGENKRLEQMINSYDALLDPELKTLYEERKKYDSSVQVINQHLASYLDHKQIEAQHMFPHYFERYKTDGVEFNMYIGQSIARDRTFNRIFLRNLRLWQLLVMCEMEREFLDMREDLPVDLEVTSLIFVYSTPISVHFRTDEKKFDVEGAYNARYEIIKKRVDKAHIKGTNERITQPGHLAVIYTQEQDAREYREYLKFLASKGYLKNYVEDLQLEDLQGVHGLRALRVPLDFSGHLTVDEFIKEIEERTRQD